MVSNEPPSPGTSQPGDLGATLMADVAPFFTRAREIEIATLMALRREYTLKALSKRYQVSVKTLYRIARRYQPDVTRNGTPPRNDE